MTSFSHIRNFSIIAHIDHGKSTLADRILQMTNTVAERDMREQVLDRMDLERERGITIKAQAVRIYYHAEDGQEYQFNLIDTPGHVDFTYEVSRSMAACEGVILVVDATQGVEAQTLANTLLALENDLEIVPVLNKIDLPGAEPEKRADEIVSVIGCARSDILQISAKTGEGVAAVLEAVVHMIPPPTGDPDGPPRALIFDSVYDQYQGVVAFVRVRDGSFRKNDALLAMATGHRSEVEEVGIFSPDMLKTDVLHAGEVGYIIPGIKLVADLRVGDTLTSASRPAKEPLPGYRDITPMVFCGLFPIDGEDYPELRDALEKLKLNDASLHYEPETSKALGFGFRCGFLGLLHMEIIRERLEREFGLDLLATTPSVLYELELVTGEVLHISNPVDFPESGNIKEVREPYIAATILVPAEYVGPVMELCNDKRGPLRAHGVSDLRPGAPGLRAAAGRDRARLLRPAQDPQPRICQPGLRAQGLRAGRPGALGHPHRQRDRRRAQPHRARRPGLHHRAGADREAAQEDPAADVRDSHPGGGGRRIIARESVAALRKDVIAKCYGGDISRKRKLLEKQKAGKKRMKMVGTVEIPQEAFLAVLDLGDGKEGKK